MWNLGHLSAHFESNGNPGAISDGRLDPGGKSYGAYQFSSYWKVIDEFMEWVLETHPDSIISNSLAPYEVNSEEFDAMWHRLGYMHVAEFLRLQHQFIRARYYEPAVAILKEHYFHIEKHSQIMQDVVWSRAVQYGVGNILEMFHLAVHMMGYPNLSYVDHIQFDHMLIPAVYDVCSSEEWARGPLRNALLGRYRQECAMALEALREELAEENTVH